MPKKLRSLFIGVLLAFIAASLPANLFTAYSAAASTEEILDSRASQYDAYQHRAAEHTADTVETVHDPTFDTVEFLTIQKDILFALERMAGVLDRYSGSGFPTHCNEYVGYYLILNSESYDTFLLNAPEDWHDMAAITIEASHMTVAESKVMVQLCANGGHGSLSEHNHAATRLALDNAMALLHHAIRVTEERTGTSAESALEKAVNDPRSGVIIENLWRQSGDAEFNSTDLYLDMLLSHDILRDLSSLYDRLLAGDSAECANLATLLELLEEPVIFGNVPHEWEQVYDGHLDSILTALDTSSAIALLCKSDIITTDTLQLHNARHGVGQAYNQLEEWIKAIEERISVKHHV